MFKLFSSIILYMFSANKISNVVENAIKSNNNVNHEEAENGRVSVLAIVLGVLVVLVLNLVVGPWLWNNVVRRLVPGTGKADWWHTVALAVLLALIVPS